MVHNLPVINKVAALAKVFGNMFGLSQVRTVAVLGLVFHNGELDKIDKSCYNLFFFILVFILITSSSRRNLLLK